MMTLTDVLAATAMEATRMSHRHHPKPTDTRRRRWRPGPAAKPDVNPGNSTTQVP